MIRRHAPWRWLPVTAWITFIWFMSAHSRPPGDPIGQLTRLVQGTALQPPVLPGTSLAFSLGKLGHLWEYWILGLLLTWALLEPSWRRHLALPLGMAAAAIDETIQRFVPGREGCLRDVAIDTSGLLLGLATFSLLTLIYKLCLNRKTKGAQA